MSAFQTTIQNIANAAPELTGLLLTFAQIAGVVLAFIAVYKGAKTYASREEMPWGTVAATFFAGLALFNVTEMISIGTNSLILKGVGGEMPGVGGISKELWRPVFGIMGVLGFFFVVRSIFKFKDIPSGQARFGEAAWMFCAGIFAYNFDRVGPFLAKLAGIPA